MYRSGALISLFVLGKVFFFFKLTNCRKRGERDRKRKGDREIDEIEEIAESARIKNNIPSRGGTGS